MLDIEESAVLEDNGTHYRFPSVQFTSEILDEGPVINKTIVIQIIEKYTEIVKKTKEFVKKERVFGEVKVRLRELFQRGRT